MGIENSKITKVMKENDSLKEELDSLKKELQVSRQKNSKDSTLDILAQETIVMNENRDQM
jgi:hypothetical protein